MKIVVPSLLAASLLLGACNSSAPPAEEKTGDTTALAETPVVMEHNTLSNEEKEQGWQLLFDGRSKNGWHVFNNTSDGAAWKVADGVLYFDTTVRKDDRIVGGGDLLTDSIFENYHLVLEWKVSQNGNSGMIFNVGEGKKYEHTYDTGPEMQVLDNAGHPDAKIPKHRAGDLYDLISCTTETVKPYGEWNKAEIKILNGKLDFFLNGTNVVSTTLWDDNWKKMLASSKFRDMADFGTIKKGHFALQDHGNLVWYRNIKIRRL